jgi:hypothetical protein
MEKNFDTRDSWSAYRNGRNYWLNLVPDPNQEPMWVARFTSGVKRVDLFCRARRQGKGERRIIDLPLVYPLDQLLMMYYFSRRKGILLHAAGMVGKGKACLFAGASGAGKSTFSLLLAAARAGKMLSDERMIVREIKGEIVAFGTPWAGTAGIACDGNAPLAGIFFLKHGAANSMKKLSAAEALDRILPVVSIPWYDPEPMTRIIAFSKRVVTAAPCYEFSFIPDSSAVDFFLKFQKTLS